MKNQAAKWALKTGICCMLSLAVLGCGAAEHADEAVYSGTIQETVPEEEKSGSGEEEAEDKKAGEGTVQEEAAKSEELIGDIVEIGDMEFTVSEVLSETLDDGAETLIVFAGGGDEAEWNMITVIYDEDTVFWKRTIWDGGEKYEDSGASPEDLKAGLMAEMNGKYEEDVYYASEIKLIEVIH